MATRTMNLITLHWLSCVVSVSEDVEQSIRRHRPGLKIRSETILNGVNVSHFVPGQFDGKDVRQSFGIRNEAPVIGTIAVFRFQKRLDLWIELAHTILGIIPEAHFIIVGDGPLKSHLLEKAQQLNLKERVHFAGLQTEVRPYLAAFDIYMMSSVFEGLPIALLEAMACGCAVVSTKAGGVKEVIRHNVDGLLCEVDEPGKLVELACDLVRDKQKRQALASQGRSRIVALFSMEKMVTKLEKLYDELIP